MAVTSQILIGYVLSDVHFDWQVENMSVYKENLFQSRREIFYKSNRGLFSRSLYAGSTVNNN